MLTSTTRNLLTSESPPPSAAFSYGIHANHACNRQHSAVLSQPQKVFAAVALAVEAKTLQGQIAAKVVTSTKNLMQITGQDVNSLLAQLGPEPHLIARSAFS
jgi:hypothetical protein